MLSVDVRHLVARMWLARLLVMLVGRVIHQRPARFRQVDRLSLIREGEAPTSMECALEPGDTGG
jgi:hypothetical protein